MVDFQGVENSVAKLEKQMQLMTQELNEVKEAIARVRREYQEECRPGKTGMREFLLERANERFGKYYYTPETNPNFFDKFYDCIKRKVKKESMVFGIICYYSCLVFCDDAVYVFKDYNPPKMEFKIKYEAIADVDYGRENTKGGSNWIEFKPINSAFENEELLKTDYDSSTQGGLFSAFSMALNDVATPQKIIPCISICNDDCNLNTVYKFFLDILEYTNS